MLRDTPAEHQARRRLPALGRRFGPCAPCQPTRRAIFLLAGVVLTLIGVLLASGAVLIPGILLLLFALLHGIGSSGCTSADLLAGWPWRG